MKNASEAQLAALQERAKRVCLPEPARGADGLRSARRRVAPRPSLGDGRGASAAASAQGAG